MNIARTMVWVVVALLNVVIASAADEASIKGTVVDQLGARVPSASVRLLRGADHVADATSDARGEFTIAPVAEGRYQLEVQADGFETTRTDPIFVGASARVATEVRLRIGPLEQQVVVTAAADDVPASQIGASVTVIDSAALDALGNTDLLESMRAVPGVEVAQTGGRGGGTLLFIRGGGSSFNKVLLDGIPANDIGGFFDFADLATTGVESVEVFRGSNSVLYGSDALTGVINIATRRGRTRIPEAALSIDGGNLGTVHADASLGGATGRVDYFAQVSRLDTDNSVPNNAYRNNTVAGRAGVMAGSRATVSGTLRVIDTEYGSPNAIAFMGIPDDSTQTRRATVASLVTQAQITDRWQSTIRAGVNTQKYRFVNPAPTGEAFDPFGFGANYLGQTTTITGGNGYSVTGRAILDFGGVYPSVFESTATRRFFYGDTGVRIAPALDLAGGVRVDDEHGTANSGRLTETDRHNYGAFVEARARAGGWLYVTGGVGVEHNAVFGAATTPRISVAAYLRKPTATDGLGETKVTMNAGNGIKEPSLGQELSSLFGLIPASTAATLGVSRIGPERSRGVDVGVEQGFARGHGRARLAYFHNQFTDLIEFVSKSALPQVGVPVAVANATGFGAYVNSQSNRSKGIEMSGEGRAGGVRVGVSYMFLDSVVTRSFSSDALTPSINPSFPTLRVGAFAPLVGARPFRRPAHSGSVTASYSAGKALVSIAGYFYGRQDDSTFLSDAFFGSSLLLPNKDLVAAYQKVDLSGSYRVHPRVRWYLTIENALDEQYQAAAGFPALPRAARTGVSVTIGGDR